MSVGEPMKAISPVIATVIIVAVAIAISIAVALWLTGIVGGFTAVENLQITYAHAEKLTTGDWKITLRVENKGTGTATIEQVFVNNMPIDYTIRQLNITLPVSINPGQSRGMEITLASGYFTSGQQVEVKLYSATGKEYPKMVTLP
jgi:FlaG/FlaF family flagellin (archaellin)